MAVEDVVAGLAIEIGKVGLWIQTIGLVIVLWFVFQVIILINNRIRRKRLGTIMDRMDRIEGKIDRILKGKKK